MVGCEGISGQSHLTFFEFGVLVPQAPLRGDSCSPKEKPVMTLACPMSPGY